MFLNIQRKSRDQGSFNQMNPLMSRNIRYIILTIVLLLPLSLFAQTNSFSVTLAPFSSLANDEFCPVYYKDGIVFCSNLRNNSLITYQNNMKGLFNIYYAIEKDNGSLKSVQLLANELTTNYNEGPVTFNEQGNIIYFCRNNDIREHIKDISDTANRLGIYYAELINGEWTNIRSFTYNNPAYFFLTPSLTPDGKRLYFASDMPGGYGGTDLYYCDRDENDWGKPVNLGPVVNTPTNEIYPFACRTGKLFFSSDGHNGFGGKDLFYTQEIDGKWITPIHLGPEINSPADDFGLITDADFQSGYFSSNRRKTDDIYSFNRNPMQFDTCAGQKENKYCFLFYDEQIALNDSVSTTYEWDFGSGVKLTGEKVKYCFPGPGRYATILRVINNDTGDTINNPKPYEFELKDIEQAYIHSAPSGIVDESMHFDALKTNLPGFTATDYLWDFGDGFTKHGPSISYTFDKKGEYIIKLGLTGERDSTGMIPKICVYKKIEILNRKGR